MTPETAPLDLLTPLGYFAIALVLFWRGSDDPMALFTALMLVLFGPYLLTGLVADLTEHPLGRLFNAVLEPLAAMITLLFLFLFPDGRFAPNWTRPLTVITVLMLALYSLLTLVRGPFLDLALPMLPLLVFGVIAQIYHYFRVSNPEQRQQTKWVVVGILGPLLGFAGYLLLYVSGIVTTMTPRDSFLFTLFNGVTILLLPVSILIAVLRFRLWDIDILIRRTLVYALLTALLALVYFGGVVILQGLFQGGAGEGSQLEVVIATLAIAALFNPLRRRVQGFIDRRFYRRRYDAQQTLQRFGEIVRDRDNADIEMLSRELLDVIQGTLQPAHLSLWLREGEE